MSVSLVVITSCVINVSVDQLISHLDAFPSRVQQFYVFPYLKRILMYVCISNCSQVYDVTPFMEDHPGGDEVLLSATGNPFFLASVYLGHKCCQRRMLNFGPSNPECASECRVT